MNILLANKKNHRIENKVQGVKCEGVDWQVNQQMWWKKTTVNGCKRAQKVILQSKDSGNFKMIIFCIPTKVKTLKVTTEAVTVSVVILSCSVRGINGLLWQQITLKTILMLFQCTSTVYCICMVLLNRTDVQCFWFTLYNLHLQMQHGKKAKKKTHNIWNIMPLLRTCIFRVWNSNLG